MSEFKFRIPDFWEFASRHARTVHLVGLDGIPRPCNVKRHEDLLVIRSNQNESAKTYIAFPFQAHGELTICTGTLPESDEPYDLAIELVRGTLNRLRNQTSIWQEGGLEIPQKTVDLTTSATEFLKQSLFCETAESHALARKSLDIAMEAIFDLAKQFGREIADFRVNAKEISPFWLAAARQSETVEHDHARNFDLLAVSTDEAIEQKNGYQIPKLIIGPLLDASPLSPFCDGDDFKSARSRLLNRCDVLLDDLPTGTTLMHVASNLNGIGQRNLSYRQQIQLTNELINRIDELANSLPMMISFDYPWAERLAWSVGGIHPLQIADELLRSGVKISFLGLDINLDYWPCGSLSRDPLQWIQLIDSWGQFGLPLVICLRIPQPASPAEFILSPDEGEPKPVNSIRENLSHHQRLELLKTVLPMIVARPGVHGVVLPQWSDMQDQRFPLAGVVDERDEPKSTLDAFTQLRANVLKR